VPGLGLLGMGAGEAHGGYKLPVSCPQPEADGGCKSPNATEATGPNLMPTQKAMISCDSQAAIRRAAHLEIGPEQQMAQ